MNPPKERDPPPHPWGEFLKARLAAIYWMKDQGLNDEIIAYRLSMDGMQVSAIIHSMKYIKENVHI